MRILFVVQRYGVDIAGGSEQCCRLFAENLAARGHHVEVATSRARDYTDWANVFPAKDEVINDVLVHRFPIDRVRDNEAFQNLDKQVVWGPATASWESQEAWIDEVGPRTIDLPSYIFRRTEEFDITIFFTYLYYPTVRGLPAAAVRVPTLFQPTAHLEPQLAVPIFNYLFRQPDGIAFLTEEEANLVRSRFGRRPAEAVVGVGCNLETKGNAETFRTLHNLGDSPLLLYIGRVDAWKGSLEAFNYFKVFKERNPSELRLIITGDQVTSLPDHPDVHLTGFIPEPQKADAIAACTAFLQPSYFESFSMALTEAWALQKPALVQGRCDVLAGQARRSGGAIHYKGYAEFDAGLQLLLEDPILRQKLSENGRRYVEENYNWDTVMTRYEDLIDRTVAAFQNRHSAQSNAGR